MADNLATTSGTREGTDPVFQALHGLDFSLGGDPSFRRHGLRAGLPFAHQDLPRHLRPDGDVELHRFADVPGRIWPSLDWAVADIGAPGAGQRALRDHDPAALLDRAYGLSLYRERQQLPDRLSHRLRGRAGLSHHERRGSCGRARRGGGRDRPSCGATPCCAGWWAEGALDKAGRPGANARLHTRPTSGDRT